MLIKLVTDFGGRETGDRHFPPGSVLEVDDALGERLIKGHRAEAMPESQEEEPIILDPLDIALHQVETIRRAPVSKPKGKKRGGR